MGIGLRPEGSAMKTITRDVHAVVITEPLVVITATLEPEGLWNALTAGVPGVTHLGVYAPAPADTDMIDLRAGAGADDALLPARGLGCTAGGGDAFEHAVNAITTAIETTRPSTVAIGLGLGSGEMLLASEAALRARRALTAQIRWLVYADSDAFHDPVRVSRRRMQLLARGVRLEPLVLDLTDDPPAAYWEIRPALTF